MSSLKCFRTGRGELGHNFTEVEPGKRGHSPGPGLAARDTERGLLIIFHDRARNRGCMAFCDEPAQINPQISGMVQFMIGRYGSAPADLDVFVAGEILKSADFTLCLDAQLRRLCIGGARFDARFRPSGAVLGEPIPGVPPKHVFYSPKRGLVELSEHEAPGGGRAYSRHDEVTLLSA